MTKEQTQQYQKQYRKDHAEHKRQWQKQYDKDHAEDKNQYQKQYDKDHADERKQYRKDHAEYKRQWQKQYFSTFRGRYLYWKHAAKRRNITWAEDLTEEYLSSLPRICYYTGQQLTLEQNAYTTISLDRLDSSKGYSRDNVVLCCGFINYMKLDLTFNQFICACRVIAQKHSYTTIAVGNNN